MRHPHLSLPTFQSSIVYRCVEPYEDVTKCPLTVTWRARQGACREELRRQPRCLLCRQSPQHVSRPTVVSFVRMSRHVTSVGTSIFPLQLVVTYSVGASIRSKRITEGPGTQRERADRRIERGQAFRKSSRNTEKKRQNRAVRVGAVRIWDASPIKNSIALIVEGRRVRIRIRETSLRIGCLFCHSNCATGVGTFKLRISCRSRRCRASISVLVAALSQFIRRRGCYCAFGTDCHVGVGAPILSLASLLLCIR